MKAIAHVFMINADQIKPITPNIKDAISILCEVDFEDFSMI